MSATCSVPVPVPAVVSAHRSFSLKRSAATALAVRILGAVGLLLCHIVLARSLGVAGFGEYAQAIAWVQVLCVFGKLGLDNTSLRYVSEYAAKGDQRTLRRYFKDATTFTVLASTALMLVVMAIVILCSHVIGSGLASCLLVASLMIPLVSVRQIHEASLRGFGLVFESQISTTVWPFVLFVLASIVWLTTSSTMSPRVATILHLIALSVVSLLVAFFIRRSILSSKIDEGTNSSQPNRSGKSRRLKVHDETKIQKLRVQWGHAATAFLLVEILIALKARVCVAMAGIALGDDSAGLYAAMERFADVSLLGAQSLGFVIAPQFASLHAAGRFSELRQLMRRGQFLILAFTLPVALGMACFGDSVFVLLGEGYRQGRSVLIALLASACVGSLAGPAALVLQMTGREQTMLRITACCAVTNVVLGLLLMHPFGILGLGYAQIATSIVWTFGMRMSLRRHPAWQRDVNDRGFNAGDFESTVIP